MTKSTLIFIGLIFILITTFLFTSVSLAEEGESTIHLREAFPGQSSSIDGGQGSLSLLGEYVSMIFRYVAALGGIIAVLVIMFAGFQLMTSGGSTEARGAAKELIQKTLVGVAMLFLSGLILYAINPNFYVFGSGSTQIQSTP